MELTAETENWSRLRADVGVLMRRWRLSETDSPDWGTELWFSFSSNTFTLLLGDPTLAAGCGLNTIRLGGRFAQKILGVILRGARAEGIRRRWSWGSHNVWLHWPSFAAPSQNRTLLIVVGYFQPVFCTLTTPPWDINLWTCTGKHNCALSSRCRQLHTYRPHGSLSVPSFSLDSLVLLF